MMCLHFVHEFKLGHNATQTAANINKVWRWRIHVWLDGNVLISKVLTWEVRILKIKLVEMYDQLSKMQPALVNHHHYHHHSVPLAWISLTLSRHSSLSSFAPGRSSMLHRVSVQIYFNSSPYPCSYVWGGPPEYIAYELGLTSLVVSRMSCSSNLDGFRDGW